MARDRSAVLARLRDAPCVSATPGLWASWGTRGHLRRGAERSPSTAQAPPSAAVSGCRPAGGRRRKPLGASGWTRARFPGGVAPQPGGRRPLPPGSRPASGAGTEPTRALGGLGHISPSIRDPMPRSFPSIIKSVTVSLENSKTCSHLCKLVGPILNAKTCIF